MASRQDNDKTRTPNYQDYYTEDDYKHVMESLPEIVKIAQKQAAETLEPTIFEKKEVRRVIRQFIIDKQRKVYGGTAINELVKSVNPDDAIYDDYTMTDIEFYSPTPLQDLVELCNILQDSGFKMVKGREAGHQETYTVSVNLFSPYCDISYVPYRVYNGIKTVVINGVRYVDPHFILIDRFRMFTDPMNSSWRWEKQFERMYKLLKAYPLEYMDRTIAIPPLSNEYKDYLLKIKNEFMSEKDVQKTCLISGFEAYNFYVRHASKDPNVDRMARTTYGKNPYAKLPTNVPFLEFISVDYLDTVERLYNFIREMVPDRQEVSIVEYFPLFQFTEYSVSINYRGQTIAKVYEANGKCVPNVKTTRGYMYVSYQFLLMMMFINKFRSHLDQDKNMYFNYAIAASNLIKARNTYLMENDLTVINNSVFGEFKVSCVGTTVNSMRIAMLRRLDRYRRGKLVIYSYDPESFDTKEDRDKYVIPKWTFRNTAGNPVLNVKNLTFQLDGLGNITRKEEKTEEMFEDEPDSSGDSDSEKSDETENNQQSKKDGGKGSKKESKKEKKGAKRGTSQTKSRNESESVDEHVRDKLDELEDDMLSQRGGSSEVDATEF